MFVTVQYNVTQVLGELNFYGSFQYFYKLPVLDFKINA